MPIQQKTKFEISEEIHQLALGLELSEVETDNVSVEDARIRYEAGRTALFALKGLSTEPEWFSRFEMLVAGNWTWRQACYIAWASMPKEKREPETQEELAKKYLNLSSDRVISTWRKKNPAIDSMIFMMQSIELWEYRGDGFRNLIEGMKRAGTDYKFFNHLRMFMELTGDYVPLSQVAAVLKKKVSGGAHDVDEDVLDDLAAGVEELNQMTSRNDTNENEEGSE